MMHIIIELTLVPQKLGPPVPPNRIPDARSRIPGGHLAGRSPGEDPPTHTRIAPPGPIVGTRRADIHPASDPPGAPIERATLVGQQEKAERRE